MKYFEFKYIQTKNGEIVNQGDAVYYTSAEQNADEMKNYVKDILKDPAAIISIPLITEIDRDTFIMNGGNPKVH
jgi:hypothetical protein